MSRPGHPDLRATVRGIRLISAAVGKHGTRPGFRLPLYGALVFAGIRNAIYFSVIADQDALSRCGWQAVAAVTLGEHRAMARMALRGGGRFHCRQGWRTARGS